MTTIARSYLSALLSFQPLFNDMFKRRGCSRARRLYSTLTRSNSTCKSEVELVSVFDGVVSLSLSRFNTHTTLELPWAMQQTFAPSSRRAQTTLCASAYALVLSYLGATWSPRI